MRVRLALRPSRPIDVWDVIDQLRDPWAIVLAESLTFLLHQADIELEWALAAGLSVLLVRVVVGLLTREPPPPQLRLTSGEKELLDYILCDRLTDRQAAALLEIPEKSVAKLLKSIFAKVGCADREGLDAWAGETDFCSTPIHERQDVRRVLTIAAFIGFGWTLFQISRTGCQAAGWC